MALKYNWEEIDIDYLNQYLEDAKEKLLYGDKIHILKRVYQCLSTDNQKEIDHLRHLLAFIL